MSNNYCIVKCDVNYEYSGKYQLFFLIIVTFRIVRNYRICVRIVRINKIFYDACDFSNHFEILFRASIISCSIFV